MDIDDLKNVDATVAEGRWVDIPKSAGLRLHVLSSVAPQAIKAFRRLARRATEAERDSAGQLLPDIEARLERDVMAEVNLIGWEGLTSKKKPVPFSRETAREMMQSNTFAAMVSDACMMAAVIHVKALGDLEKN